MTDVVVCRGGRQCTNLMEKKCDYGQDDGMMGVLGVRYANTMEMVETGGDAE